MDSAMALISIFLPVPAFLSIFLNDRAITILFHLYSSNLNII
jgi:hypothetical protein